MKPIYLYIVFVMVFIITIVAMHYNYKRHEGRRRALVYYAATVDLPCEDVIKFIKENL